MYKEFRKVCNFLAQFPNLHAEMKFAEENSIDDKSTILVVDVCNNILAESDNADEIIKSLNDNPNISNEPNPYLSPYLLN